MLLTVNYDKHMGEHMGELDVFLQLICQTFYAITLSYFLFLIKVLYLSHCKDL